MLDNIRNNAQSWGVKLIFAVIILVFVFWGATNTGGLAGGAIGTVNGEPVDFRTYRSALENVLARSRQQMDPAFTDEQFAQLRVEVFNEIARSLVIKQEAKRLGITVTPHELRLARDSRREFQDAAGNFDPKLYRQMLEAMRITPDQFIAGIEDEMLINKFIRYIAQSNMMTEAEARQMYAFQMERRVADYVLFAAQEYKDKVSVTDEDVSRYYEANKENFRLPVRARVEYLALTPESLAGNYAVSEEDAKSYYSSNVQFFAVPETVQVRHIFIAVPEGDAEKTKAAEAKAALVAAKVKEGADFGDLAREYSEDPQSAPLGGMLAWMERGTVGSEEFDATVFSMNPGEVSDLIRSPAGLHIVKMEGKNAASQRPFEEVKTAIMSAQGREKALDDFKNIEKQVEDALATGMPFAEIGSGFLIEPKTTELLPQQEVEQLLALHADSLRILTDTVATVADSGKESTIPVPLNLANGIVLVKVLEAKPSELSPLEEEKTVITNLLQNEAAMKLARTAAEEALPQFTGSAIPSGFNVRQSGEFSRALTLVEPLGNQPALVEALSASTGNWLPAVYDVAGGSVIAKVAKVEPVTDAQWNADKDNYASSMEQFFMGQSFAVYMEHLLEKAKIELSRERLEEFRPQ